jgi:geranylgeranyl reductase family protein
MYQVIVVGAGPVGTVTAAILAGSGCRVLLLDKAEFPRDKVCGDAIGLNTINLLSRAGLALESRTGAFHWCDRFRGVSLRGYVFEGSLTEYATLAYIIPRKILDHTLWELALQRGVEFERLCVTEPIVKQDVVCGIRGKFGDKIVERRARITIAADGAHSAIAQSLRRGKAADKHYAVSVRAYFGGVQGSDRQMDFYATSTGFPGYGWLFPIGDGKANVGIGFRLDALRRSGRTLRQEFDQFIADPRVAGRLSQAEPVGRVQGWTLPLTSQPLQRAYAGALLVGDAGAFVCPLSGGGIHRGIVSGKLAAEVALEALQKDDYSLKELGKFEARWRRVLGKGLWRKLVLQRVLSWPGVVDLALENMERSGRIACFILGLRG